MTPNSTDRIGAVSPLENLLSSGHPPTSLKDAQAFESLLHHSTGTNGIGSFRSQLLERSPVERNGSSLSSVNESRSADARASASSSKGRSPTVIHGPKSGPTPREDDQDRDSAGDAAARGDAATTPPVTNPPAQQTPATENQGISEETSDDGNPQPQEQAAILDESITKISPQTNDEAASQPQSDATTAGTDLLSTSVAISPAAAEPSLNLQQEESTSEVPGQSRTDNTAPLDGAVAVAAQAGQGQSPSTAAAINTLQAIDAAGASVAEIAATEETGKNGEEKADHNKSDKNEVESLISPEIVASSPVSPLDESSATATDKTVAGALAAAVPSAPEASAEGASPPAGAVQGPSSRLPSHELAQVESRRGRAAAPLVVDNARFLGRVAKAFMAAQQRGGEIRLRLSPPELGSLRLQVSVQEGVMVARMETETDAARATLTSNLPALRERLAEQGIRVERFDIDLMQQPSTGTSDRPADPQQQHHPRPERSLRSIHANAEPAASAATGNAWSGQGRLNVII